MDFRCLFAVTIALVSIIALLSYPCVVVMTSLRELSMKTSILSDPSQVPQQLTQYAKDDLQQSPSEVHHRDLRHLS